MVPLRDEDLDALGLRGATIAASDTFTWPGGDAAEGKGFASAAFIALVELAASVQFRSVNVGIAERQAIHVEAAVEARGVVRLSVSDDVDVADVRGLPAHAVLRDPSDPGIVTLDFREMPFGAVLVSDGRILGLAFDGTRMTIADVEPPEGPAPLATIEAERAIEWCRETGDEWLLACVQSNVDMRDPWHAALAVALYDRLRPVAPPADTDRVFAWTAALTEAQRSTLIDLAVAEIDGVLSDLEELESLVDRDEADWPSVLRRVCIRRDDLEAIRVLLREIDTAAARVDPLLEHLDAIGRQAIASLPIAVVLQDERLQRVGSADPYAWWVRLVET